jgi:hypothetical protein
MDYVHAVYIYGLRRGKRLRDVVGGGDEDRPELLVEPPQAATETTSRTSAKRMPDPHEDASGSNSQSISS